MEIDINELAQILPDLSVAARQEIEIHILRFRLETSLHENHELRQTVSKLEEYVRSPAELPFERQFNGVQVADPWAANGAPA
jgi:hypothetical protein